MDALVARGAAYANQKRFSDAAADFAKVRAQKRKRFFKKEDKFFEFFVFCFLDLLNFFFFFLILGIGDRSET